MGVDHEFSYCLYAKDNVPKEGSIKFSISEDTQISGVLIGRDAELEGEKRLLIDCKLVDVYSQEVVIMEEVERWYNLEEIANHLGVSKDTIRSYIKKAQFRFIKWVGNISLSFQKWMPGLRAARVPMQINKKINGGNQDD